MLSLYAAAAPSPPTFDIIGRTDVFVNITWEPSRSANPGSVFYVQYRPRGMHHWLRSPDEYMDNYMEIYDLDPGTVYQVRVVAINGDDISLTSVGNTVDRQLDINTKNNKKSSSFASLSSTCTL